MIGTVYLLHFSEPYPRGRRGSVRHYLGFTLGCPHERLTRHLCGRGSPLVAAAAARGIEIEIARTWSPADRKFERRLKNRHEAPRLCPACARSGLTRSRVALAIEPEAA